jgi:hypothetical protein
VKVLYLFFITAVFSGCILAPTLPPPVLGNLQTSTLVGEWQTPNEDDAFSFSLRIWQSRDSIYGAYCAIVQSQLDCADPKTHYACFGTLNPFEPDVLETTFSDNQVADTGRVRLRLIQEELYWEMLQRPKRGKCLAPAQTVLHKIERR